MNDAWQRLLELERRDAERERRLYLMRIELAKLREQVLLLSSEISVTLTSS